MTILAILLPAVLRSSKVLPPQGFECLDWLSSCKVGGCAENSEGSLVHLRSTTHDGDISGSNRRVAVVSNVGELDNLRLWATVLAAWPYFSEVRTPR